MATPIKENDARLNFRLRPDLKDRIEKAAAVSGRSITEFAVAALSETADEILERERVVQLSDRDRDIFLKVLDRAEKPNANLKRAAKTHKRLIVR